MSIIGFKERSRPPLGIREDGSKHGYRLFEFTATDDTATLAQMLAAASSPQRGDAHPDDSAATLRSFDKPYYIDEGIQTVILWKVHYDSRVQFDSDQGTIDALIRAGFRAVDREVPAIFDAFGRPNVNSAGDLIPGLKKLANDYVLYCTAPLATIPASLLGLNNTLNNSVLTIRGIDFQPGTLMLKNLDIPDTPDIDSDTGTGFWNVTYDIMHSPDGFYELHPNRGKHELVYQVKDGDGIFQDTTPADYEAEATAGNKRIQKRRIQTEDDQAAAEDVWLDAFGQAILKPQFTTTAIGTGGMTLRDKTLTLATGSFATDGSQDGATVAIVGAGQHGRILRTVITSVTDASNAEVEDLCCQAVSGADVYLPGVIAVRVINQPFADWATVPLPDNDP